MNNNFSNFPSRFLLEDLLWQITAVIIARGHILSFKMLRDLFSVLLSKTRLHPSCNCYDQMFSSYPNRMLEDKSKQVIKVTLGIVKR